MSTLERLQSLLVSNDGLPRARLQRDVHLEGVGVHSLALITIVFAVEDEFDIRMDGDVTRFKALGDVVRHVDRLLMQDPVHSATA